MIGGKNGPFDFRWNRIGSKGTFIDLEPISREFAEPLVILSVTGFAISVGKMSHSLKEWSLLF